jgi:glycosyltransferase involved in cell wall biosynthesis
MCSLLVEGLRARGHQVFLAAAGPKRTPGEFFQTYRVPPSRRLGQAIPELVHAARSSRALDSAGLDVIHDHSAAGPLAAAWRRAPTVATTHGPVTGEMGDFYRALNDQIWLVAVSDAQRRSAKDLRWVRTVHHGIDVRAYPFRESKDPFLLFLGRMSREKGAHLAIEAARATGRQLILAGKCIEPDEVEYFETEIRPRLSDDVRFVGELDSLSKTHFLSRARCLLFPIQWAEPFGIVMIEAMACGTPVVALSGGSVEEIVSDGRTGFVRTDPDELPEAIEAAGLLDPFVCRDHVSRRFDVEAMVDGYELVYRYVIRRSQVGDRMATGNVWPGRTLSALRTGQSGAPVQVRE